MPTTETINVSVESFSAGVLSIVSDDSLSGAGTVASPLTVTISAEIHSLPAKPVIVATDEGVLGDSEDIETPFSRKKWTFENLVTFLTGSFANSVDVDLNSTHRISDGKDHADVNLNTTHRGLSDNPHAVTKTQVGLGSADDTSDVDKPISTLQQNAFDLKADLVEGVVPASQLPSYVDDVLEYADLASFPATGESSKIYIALDTDLIYRWATTVYVNISDTLSASEIESLYEGLANTNKYTDTEKSKLTGIEDNATADQLAAEVPIADAGNKITATDVEGALQENRTEIDLNTNHRGLTDNPHSVTKLQVGLGNVDDTSDIAKPISTLQQDALDLKADLVGGLVPASQLPSYVDDVLEVATKVALPVTGEASILYIVVADESAGGDTSTYRWTGTVYALIHDTLSATDIASLYEGLADTNKYTDAEKTKLGTIEDSATADQTDLEIKTAYENNANTNEFNDTEKTLLGTVETNAAADQNAAEVPIADAGNKITATDVEGALQENRTEIDLNTNHRGLSDNPHSVTKLQVGLGNVDDTSDVDKPISTLQQTALDLKADLVGGTVPASQLPSYVDDVEEYANFAAFPATGESSKIYVTLDTNLTYRWTGTVYTEISKSLALGETDSTAYRGDRGKTAYDHSQATHAPTDADNTAANETSHITVDNHVAGDGTDHGMVYLNNMAAGAAPTGDDDSGDGYSVGSLWQHGTDLYRCLDDTATSAIWRKYVESGTEAGGGLAIGEPSSATGDYSINISARNEGNVTNGIYAWAYIQILDFTQLSGKTLTLNDTVTPFVFTEGVDFDAITSVNATALSLRDAINTAMAGKAAAVTLNTDGLIKVTVTDVAFIGLAGTYYEINTNFPIGGGVVTDSGYFIGGIDPIAAGAHGSTTIVIGNKAGIEDTCSSSAIFGSYNSFMTNTQYGTIFGADGCHMDEASVGGIFGGQSNSIVGIYGNDAYVSTLVGGYQNQISGVCNYTTIIGGSGHRIIGEGGADAETIIGGSDCTIVTGNNWDSLLGCSDTIDASYAGYNIGLGASNGFIAEGGWNTILAGMGNYAGKNHTGTYGRNGYNNDIDYKVVHSYWLTDSRCQRGDLTWGTTTDDGVIKTLVALPINRKDSTNNLTDVMSFGYKVTLTAIQTSTGTGTKGDSCIHTYTGGIKNITGATSLVGTPNKTIIAEDAGATAWGLTITADDAADTLKIECTGEASKDIKWAIKLETIEVG